MLNEHQVLKWLENEFKPPYPIAGVTASNQYANTLNNETAVALIDFVEAQRDLPPEIKDMDRYNNALESLEDMLAPIEALIEKAKAKEARLAAGRKAALQFDKEFVDALSDVYDTFVIKAQKIADEHKYHVDNQWFYQLGQGVKEIRAHEANKQR